MVAQLETLRHPELVVDRGDQIDGMHGVGFGVGGLMIRRAIDLSALDAAARASDPRGDTAWAISSARALSRVAMTKRTI